MGRTATLRGTLIATQAPQATNNTTFQSTHSHQQSAHSFPGLNLNPFCLLLQATQPPTIPTPNTSKNLNLRINAQSLAFKEPTNNNQLEAEATNQFSSRALAAAGNQQAPQPGQRAQSSSKLIQHHIQRTNQLEARYNHSQSVATSAFTTVCRHRYLQKPNRLTVMSFNKFHVTLKNQQLAL